MNAKTAQVNESLKKDISKLGAVVQSLNDKVVAQLNAQDIKIG
jgi:hypothetical protein